jgi:hypothetical protein
VREHSQELVACAQGVQGLEVQARVLDAIAQRRARSSASETSSAL